MKAAAWLGLSRRHLLIETYGRRSGRKRRNVVGMKIIGETGWVVAEQGRNAGYVRNLEADPRVRVRIRRRWRDARARVGDGDDAQARLDSFGDRRHAAAVRRFGTELLSIRFDFVHVESSTREAREE
jgi:deazaflavin-dependent oxidoreductase (nitroreductase family)